MQPGAVIAGRYQVGAAVGEGAMAAVYRGTAKSSELFARPVAIKVMKPAFAANAQHIEMFLEEARIGADLQHPHLIQVLDFVAQPTPRGNLYCLVMEWIDGVDLRTLIRTMARLDRPLPWALVAHVGVGVLRGLAAAHERRLASGASAPVVHRDVSPQNVLLGVNGAIKLADFGMARARDRVAKMTAPGIVKGTLSYMAPEILKARPAAPASDLFSLACTLWEALAGEKLFDGETDAHVVAAIRGGKIRPLEDLRPDVPSRLVAALGKALASEPDDRFMSARTMVNELGEILRQNGPFIDADLIVGTTVAQAREALAAGGAAG